MIFTGFQFQQVVKNLSGKPYKRKETEDSSEIDMQVGYLLRLALTTDLKERTPQGITPDPHEEKKYDLYRLATEIRDTTEEKTLEIKSEDITILKTRLRLALPIEMMGFVVDILEGKNTDFNVVSTKSKSEGLTSV